VRSKNANTIELLNQSLDPDEDVQIEPPEEVICSEIELNENTLKQEQVKIITQYLSKYLISEKDSEIDMIREIAVKISKNSTDLNDALNLMKIAQRHRPDGRRIKKLICKLEQKLD
jgi:hypothetical protein